ncbi:hypothetical protein BC833DRAFT_621620 [Globomyces pollinis-pini]|nr:hypothetical protein BC833DRAFT_621620 [Globomyces pollinis-pini]
MEPYDFRKDQTISQGSESPGKNQDSPALTQPMTESRCSDNDSEIHDQASNVEETDTQDGNDVDNDSDHPRVKYNRDCREVKDRVKKSKEMSDNAFEKLYEIQMEKFKIEEELIRSKKHPKYLQKMVDLSEFKECRIERAKKLLNHCKSDIYSNTKSNIKLAHDTLLASKREMRTNFITTITKQYFDLLQTHQKSLLEVESRNHDQINKQLARIFTVNPNVLYKRKRSMIDEFRDGNIDESEIPDWILQMVRKKHRAGFHRIWMPNGCGGLNENEKQEDVDYLRTVLSISDTIKESN